MSIDTTLSKPSDYAGTGRVSSLTPELQVSICEYIAQGNYLTTSCRAVGITDQTYRAWLEQGRAEEENGDTDGRFQAFLGAVKRAEAIAEAARVERIAKAGEGGTLSKRTIYTQKDGSTREEETFTTPQWLADMTHLERRHPERWARPVSQGSGGGGGDTYNVFIEKAIITAAGKFDAAMARIARRADDPVAIPGELGVPAGPAADGTEADDTLTGGMPE